MDGYRAFFLTRAFENKIKLNKIMEEKLITFEYGAMSSRYALQAKNKLTAYAAMICHFQESNHLIALYEPKEIVKDDSWLNITGEVAERIDEIFGGEGAFDEYVDQHIEEIKEAYKTIF